MSGAVTQKENEKLVEANKGKIEGPKIVGTSGQSEFEQKLSGRNKLTTG